MPYLALLLALVLGACDGDNGKPASGQISEVATGKGGVSHTSNRSQALIDDHYAYHIGVLGYLYGYPLVDQYKRQHNSLLANSESARLPSFDPMSSLGFFETLNVLLREDGKSLKPGDAQLLIEFDAVGFGPTVRFDAKALSPARKRGLERALRDARVLLEASGDLNGAETDEGAAEVTAQSLLRRAGNYRALAEQRSP